MYTLIIIYMIAALVIGLFSTALVASEVIKEIRAARQKKKAEAAETAAKTEEKAEKNEKKK